MSDQPTPPAPKPADPKAPDTTPTDPAGDGVVPTDVVDPAVTTGTPAGDLPAGPPAPPVDPPAAPSGLCPICFPLGLPEGYKTAGCEHSA